MEKFKLITTGVHTKTIKIMALSPFKKFLINLTLFIVYTMDAFVIRGDGPNGFGEFVIKGIILLAGLIFLIASAVSLTVIESSESPRSFLIVIYKFSTFWLVLFAILAIFDACSDHGGYCRRDGIHFSS